MTLPTAPDTGPAEAALAAPESTGDLDRMARGGMWSVLAHLSTAGAVFLTSVLIGRAVGPQALGQFSFFVWILRLAPTVIAIGVPTAITRMVSEKEGQGAPGLALALFRAAVRLHLMLVPVPALVIGALVWRSETDVALGLFVAGGLAAGLLALDYESLLNGLRQFRSMSIAAVATATAQLVATGAGVVLDFGWEGFVASYVVATFIGLVATQLLARRAVAGVEAAPLPAEDRARFFAYARVVAVVVILDAFVWGRPELWFLERFSTDLQLGYYSAALRLASLPAVLPLVAGRVLLPEFSWLQAAGRHRDVARLFPRICILLMAATAPVAVGGALLAGPVMDLVFGSEFAGAATPTAILFAGSVVNAMAPAVSSAVLTGPRPRFVAEAGAVALIANLVLATILIPAHGALGAAVANTIVQLSLIPVAGYYVQTRMGLHYPWWGVGRVMLFAGAAALVGALPYAAIDGVLGLLAAVLVGSAAYGAILLGTHTIEADELRRLARRQAPGAAEAVSEDAR